MQPADLLRTVGPLLVAFGATLLVDLLTRRRGLDPPGFSPPADAPRLARLAAAARRGLALGLLAVVLYVGVFSALGLIGVMDEPDWAAVHTAQLFFIHGCFLLTVLVWYALGFLGVGLPTTSWSAQLGWRSPRVLPELGLGLVAGVGAWIGVLAVLLLLSVLVTALGGEGILLEEPPAMVAWIAALPVWVRLSLSLSAGVVEETFFRGFLQPRVGIGVSTVLFTLGHLSYEQPLMLVGVTLLSLIFARLVVWRQSLWAAAVAHTVFDALQLVVVIPWILRRIPGGGLLSEVASLMTL